MSNITQKEQVVFRNICIYPYTYVYMHRKEAINFKGEDVCNGLKGEMGKGK